jgi:hypothetical protein
MYEIGFIEAVEYHDSILQEKLALRTMIKTDNPKLNSAKTILACCIYPLKTKRIE